MLLDYVDIVVHIQHAEEREFYALDKLWKDCPTIPFVDRDMVDADAPPALGRGVSRLIVWRHGNTDWNASHRVQGQTDVPLNAVGRQQAVDAAELLIKLRPDVDRRQRPAAGPPTRRRRWPRSTGLPISYDKRLRERYFGAWQGLTMAEVAELYPDEYARWTAGQEVGGDVETLDDLGKRVADGAARGGRAGAARRHGRGGHPRRRGPAGHRSPARLAAASSCARCVPCRTATGSS